MIPLRFHQNVITIMPISVHLLYLINMILVVFYVTIVFTVFFCKQA